MCKLVRLREGNPRGWTLIHLRAKPWVPTYPRAILRNPELVLLFVLSFPEPACSLISAAVFGRSQPAARRALKRDIPRDRGPRGDSSFFLG